MSENKINFYLNNKKVEANKMKQYGKLLIGLEQKYLIFVIQTNLVTELMETVELVWLRLKVKEF